ncbi:hypothetical protein ACFFKU_12510 [Kineococcus gynurae]|uniref:Uncharacterized protein n=1 Tax=Kineococcus gynurae TaxID=452979 RepID=A0ABV5LQP0_9ACTN
MPPHDGGGPPTPSGGRQLLLLAGLMIALVAVLIGVSYWAAARG